MTRLFSVFQLRLAILSLTSSTAHSRRALGARDRRGEGQHFWDGEGSEARLKALAACEWVRVTNAADTDTRWEFSVVLDQDSLSIASLEGLRSDALVSCPEQYDDDLNTSV